MFNLIIAAATLLAVDGTCIEADAYPSPADVTGYVTISHCAIPTTARADEPTIVAVYANALDRMHGGRNDWQPGECRIMPAGHELEFWCQRDRNA